MKTRSLQIHHPDGSTQIFAIEKPTVKIGRADDNDVLLIDSERSVSRWHARIASEADSNATISDLNSANGTTVNGRSVRTSVPLRSNDNICIGSFRIVFREETTEVPFTIQTSAVDLRELQREPQLLALAGAREFASATELRSLELLFEVGLSLARSHSVEDVTATAVELLFKIEQVHRATVILWDEAQASFGSAELHFRGGRKVTSGAAAYDPRNLVMSRTILNKVRQDNRPLLIRDTKSEAMLSSAMSIVGAGIQAAFCSPLTYQGQFLGILYADNLAQPDAFSDTDFRVFAAIAAQAGLALATAVANKELLKREVQREALKAYLPPQVADLILSSDGAVNLAGTLQDITVLFADIRGFTRMSERMDARELVHMLSEFFTAMSELIVRHGGIVDKFIGDCIMALFGAPVVSQKSADEALAAAVAMQRKASELNAKREAAGLSEIHIGIGLHTGPAVVGNIGSAERVQYTAIGDTVNVASRLVSRAEPDRILVSDDFRKAVSGTEQLQLIGEAELKGRQNRINIYWVRWNNEQASVMGAAGGSGSA